MNANILYNLYWQWAGHKITRGHPVLMKYLNVLIYNVQYIWQQASKHTHMHNAVPLVWGLFRLAPIKYK